RNIATDDEDETFIVEQLSGDATNATIKVTAFGRSNTYTHVHSITGNFGTGADSIVIGDSVKVPVTIDAGSGDDAISYGGANTAMSTLSGGTDSLYLTLSASPDALTISSPSANTITLALNGTNRSASTVEKFFLDGRAGADTFIVEDLGGSSGLTNLTIDLGKRVTVNGTRTENVIIDGTTFAREVPDTRIDPDLAGDTITIRGSTSPDTYNVTLEAQAASTGRTGTDIKVARTGSYTV